MMPDGEMEAAAHFLARRTRRSDPYGEIKAVAAQAATRDWGESVESVLAYELGLLWRDLDDARRLAADGLWSIQCGWTVERIMALTRVLGRAHPWASTPVAMLVHGWYQHIHAIIGVDAPVSEDGLRRAHTLYRTFYDVEAPGR